MFFTSCLKEEDVVYSSNWFFRNNTGHVIEVYKDDLLMDEIVNGEAVWLYSTQSSVIFEDVSFEKIMQEQGWKFKDVSIYGVSGGERKFLKKWTFPDRNKEGKQLYRLSDSELVVSNECSMSYVKISYNYTFTINPEDLGL